MNKSGESGGRLATFSTHRLLCLEVATLKPGRETGWRGDAKKGS